MTTRQKVTVAVTALNNIDSPGPGIPVIRGLLESTLYDVRIIGLSYEPMEPGKTIPKHSCVWLWARRLRLLKTTK